MFSLICAGMRPVSPVNSNCCTESTKTVVRWVPVDTAHSGHHCLVSVWVPMMSHVAHAVCHTPKLQLCNNAVRCHLNCTPEILWSLFSFVSWIDTTDCCTVIFDTWVILESYYTCVALFTFLTWWCHNTTLCTVNHLNYLWWWNIFIHDSSCPVLSFRKLDDESQSKTLPYLLNVNKT